MAVAGEKYLTAKLRDCVQHFTLCTVLIISFNHKQLYCVCDGNAHLESHKMICSSSTNNKYYVQRCRIKMFVLIDAFSLCILFSHFRPCDVIPENHFFQMPSYPSAFVCTCIMYTFQTITD